MEFSGIQQLVAADNESGSTIMTRDIAASKAQTRIDDAGGGKSRSTTPGLPSQLFSWKNDTEDNIL